MDLYNRLEKHIPPPFVTVDVNSKGARSVLLQWNKFQKKSKYSKIVEPLAKEVDFLNGYVLRKGQQLRSEKALQLTLQASKLSHRWKSNELQAHFHQFCTAFGSLRPKRNKDFRRPSRQWGSWILYLMLRETAILAKMKLVCEETTTYWLGMISAEHHWGDSLVITAILSRIWHLCSCILEEFMNFGYNAILSIHDILQPTNSINWPRYDWTPPPDLYNWLRHQMNISFEKARLNVSLSYLERKATGGDTGLMSLLHKTFENANTPENYEEVVTKPESVDPFFFDSTGNSENADTSNEHMKFVSFSYEKEKEDCGFVLSSDTVVSRNPKRSKKLGKKEARLLQSKEIAEDISLKFSESYSVPEKPKSKIKCWKSFSKAAASSLKNNGKMMGLKSVINEYKTVEQMKSPSIQNKFSKLTKLVHQCEKDGGTDRIKKFLTNFNSFIQKKSSRRKEMRRINAS